MTSRFQTFPVRSSEDHSTAAYDRFVFRYECEPQPINLKMPRPKMYVIFNPDSIQAIHTAAMVRRLIPMYTVGISAVAEAFKTEPGQRGISKSAWKDLSWRQKLKPSNLKARFSNVKPKVFDIVLLNVQNAIVEDEESATFVWLGLEPRRNVAPHMNRSAWAGCRHITFSETPTTIFSESHIGYIVNASYHEHNGWYTNGSAAMRDNGNNLSALKYGMMLEFLSRMDRLIHLSHVVADLGDPDVIDYFIRKQHLVSSFETRLIDKDTLEKSFVKTVEAMRELGLPGSTINIDDPAKALATQIASVRTQMKATGSLATAVRGKQVIRSYCTKLTEFFWVAKRLIRFEHEHYANITLCNTGVLMSSNVPTEYAISVNTDLYRSK